MYNERKVYLQTRLRNLKRKYAKLTKHADLMDEAIELKSEIDAIEFELERL